MCNKEFKDEISVFTDGSFCKKNNSVFSGYGIHFPNEEIEDVSRPFTHEPITNQRAELYAIYKAIYYVSLYFEFNKLIIYSDSQYSISCVTEWIKTWKANGWMTSNKQVVKNQDIIKKIDKLMDKYSNKIKFIHVKSHTGNNDYLSIGNDIADKLANNGRNK